MVATLLMALLLVMVATLLMALLLDTHNTVVDMLAMVVISKLPLKPIVTLNLRWPLM
jgi:hypothetical protein